jgi:phosphinothricin acetyltransferase
MAVPVRLATEADAEAITRIVNAAILRSHAHFSLEPDQVESTRAAWRSEHERYPWLVADGSDGVIGYALATRHRVREAYDWTVQTSVYLDPNHVRAGVGSALYERLLATLRAQGYVVALAGVALPNAPSVALHEKLGFKRVALFERVGWKFRRWHDVAYYHLFLQPPAAEPDAEPGPLRSVAEVWARQARG